MTIAPCEAVMGMQQLEFGPKESKTHCIVFTHLYSASCSAHQPQALPVWETQREETWLFVIVISKHLKCH